MTTSYNLVVGKNPAVPHSGASFDDVALLLRHALASLGLPSTTRVNAFDPAAVNVVLGGHHLPAPAPVGDHACVFYQLEQLPGARGLLELTDARRDLYLAARGVWDYSPVNVAALAARGVGGVRLLPFGYHPALETIAPAEPEYDVLFYGAVNARRKAVLDALAKRCRVKAVFGVFGERRDRLIARSRVVLNLHHYPAHLMEQPRLSYLLNNRRFVVSEESPDDPYGGAVVTAPYEGLVDVCLRYAGDPAGRERRAADGYDFLRARPMAELVRGVLPG